MQSGSGLHELGWTAGLAVLSCQSQQLASPGSRLLGSWAVEELGYFIAPSARV